MPRYLPYDLPVADWLCMMLSAIHLHSPSDDVKRECDGCCHKPGHTPRRQADASRDLHVAYTSACPAAAGTAADIGTTVTTTASCCRLRVTPYHTSCVCLPQWYAAGNPGILICHVPDGCLCQTSSLIH
jgi:hypothetical protein